MRSIAAPSLLCISVVAAEIAATAPAHAYSTLPCHVSSNVAWTFPGAISNDHQIAVDAAVNWHTYTGGILNPVESMYHPNSFIQISAANFGNVGWDGMSTADCGGIFSAEAATRVGNASQTTTGKDVIQINRSYTAGYPWTKTQSVFSHEFGHAFGLDHSGHDSTPCASVPNMLPNTPHRYACGAYYPQPDDVSGIRATY